MMFVVLLRFSENKTFAHNLMDEHNDWLARGFADGTFVLAGSIHPAAGGAIIARGSSVRELQRRVDADPFVSKGVVSAEVIEITPGKVDDRLSFLLDESQVN